MSGGTLWKLGRLTVRQRGELRADASLGVPSAEMLLHGIGHRADAPDRLARTFSHLENVLNAVATSAWEGCWYWSRKFRVRKTVKAPVTQGRIVVYNPKMRSQHWSSSAATRDTWHAVSVVGGPAACPAATEMGAKRFLPQDAPRLPMLDCAWPSKCACVYRHYSDRRAGPRRASERGRPWRTMVPERRTARGRRADD